MASKSLSLIVVVALLLLGGGAFYYLEYSKPAFAEDAPLTPEGKAYVRNLQLSDVTMKATESYMKQKVVEILGKISNNGSRTVNVVEINCVFRDPYGQVVLRERVTIVGRAGPMAPGMTKNFRLAFDTIPESWNQALPDLVIAQIVFE